MTTAQPLPGISAPKPSAHLAGALSVATRAHLGQRDKAGQPYINHVIRVMERVTYDGEATMVVALLHDVLEDSGYSVTQLRERFGDEIADDVVALTNVEGESLEARAERIRARPRAVVVKLADIDDNADEWRLGLLDDDVADRVQRDGIFMHESAQRCTEAEQLLEDWLALLASGDE